MKTIKFTYLDNRSLQEVSMLFSATAGTALELSAGCVDSIVQICQGNFENQAKGVPDLCKSIFRYS